MKKDKILELAVMLIYTCLGSFGMLLSFAGAFQISYNKNALYLGAGAFCVIGTVILYFVNKYKIAAAVGLGIAGNLVLLLITRGKLYKGIITIVDRMSVLYDSYIGHYEISTEGMISRFPEAGLLCFYMVFTTIIIYGVVCSKRAWCTFVMMIIGISIPFAIGEVPKNGPLICMLIVILGAAFSKMGSAGKSKIYKSGLIGISAGFLAFAVGSVIVQMPLEGMIDKNKPTKEAITSFWEKKIEHIFQGNNGTGGVNSGELGRVGRFAEDSEKVHLKIRLNKKPESRIYLQGYIGTEYTGKKWKKSNENTFYEWLNDRKYTWDDVKNLQYNMLAQATVGQFYMEIENIAANPKYQYRPYAGMYGEDLSYVGDSYISLGEQDRQEYVIWYYPYEQLENGYVFLNDENKKQIDLEYEAFVKEQYENVPRDVWDTFRDEITKIQSVDTNLIIGEVANLLSERTSYSTSPGKTPRGEDFAEYFYFKNKKGYCSHYATTAALLLRMKGIPARYVTGYVIDPERFQEKADGSYEAEITGESAHAWAEVYHSGSGWLPAETTPGYAENQYVTGQETVVDEIGQETPKETPVQTPKPTVPEKQNTENNMKNEKEQDAEEHSDGYIIAGIIIVLLSVVLLYGWRKYRMKKRRINAAREGYNRSIQKLFYKFYDKLVSDKIVEKDMELDEGFAERISQSCEAISREDAEKLLDIVYRANYGREELGREEYQFLRRILILEKTK